MDEFISTFHIDWKLMLAQAVNFGLVFVALYLIAAKPLRKLIQDRGQEITTGLENAKQNAEMLANTKKEYDAALQKAVRKRTLSTKPAKKMPRRTSRV
ncbi:MAG: hypothetical protein WDN09_03200 [bacterium]